VALGLTLGCFPLGVANGTCSANILLAYHSGDEWCTSKCLMNPLGTTKNDISYWTISAIIRQAIELDRCSKHVRIWKI